MAYDATFHRSARRREDEGPPFAYTAENRARFDEIVKRYPPDRRRSAVLPALYLVQHQHGYITANGIRHVAELLGITRADVEDVVSYYSMFYTKPVGKFVLNVCRTLSCAGNEGDDVTKRTTARNTRRMGEPREGVPLTWIQSSRSTSASRTPSRSISTSSTTGTRR